MITPLRTLVKMPEILVKHEVKKEFKTDDDEENDDIFLKTADEDVYEHDTIIL